LTKVIADTAPTDLRKMNRAKLSEMGVLDKTADAFVANGSYTPREQTVLVSALAEMSATQGRRQFIKTASNAVHYDVTYFRQVQAEMYAAHNRTISPLKTFIKLGPFISAVSEDNVVVVCLPMDYMLWTEAMAKATQSLSEHVNNLEWATGQKMYFTGSVSPLALKNLKGLGWEVIENTSAL
jgi:phage terminase large subunit